MQSRPTVFTVVSPIRRREKYLWLLPLMVYVPLNSYAPVGRILSRP